MPTECTTLRQCRVGIALLLMLCPAESRAQTPPEIAGIMARLAAVPERRASFREEKHIAALTIPLISTGTLLYRRPGHLEKLTTWPERESLVVEQDQVVLTAGAEPPRVIPLSADAGLRALVDVFRAPLAGDLAALSRSFQVQGGGNADTWQLDLTPTNPAVARFLRRVQVAGSGDRLQAILVVQANGDEQHITIETVP